VARRIALVAPAGENTRPTADRAKEALFNILSERVCDARFLDIFCGSGAIGIEALSRGAKEAVFVENSPAAVKAVKENLAKTKLLHAEILETTAERAIARLAAQNRLFDIIFLDPPYDSSLLSKTLAQLKQFDMLAENGVIVAETDAKIREFPKPDTSEIYARTYGRTKFFFFE
jgi:16S rRNA (guanine(966)-N(2))-methyltransferase RsmD